MGRCGHSHGQRHADAWQPVWDSILVLTYVSIHTRTRVFLYYRAVLPCTLTCHQAANNPQITYKFLTRQQPLYHSIQAGKNLQSQQRRQITVTVTIPSSPSVNVHVGLYRHSVNIQATLPAQHVILTTAMLVGHGLLTTRCHTLVTAGPCPSCPAILNAPKRDKATAAA